MIDPNFKTRWWTPRLAGPLIAAAVIRLGLLAVALVRGGTDVIVSGDTNSYLEPGRNLLLHGRFIAEGVPDLLRTPAYPLFLAITSLWGLPAAAVVNALLSVFSVILVWRLGATVFTDARIALAAAWIFAFEPLSIVNSGTLLSETLFLTLFLLSLERLAEFLRARSLPALAISGLWLAAATLVRPVTYYLPAALALGLVVTFARVPGLPPQRHGPIAGDPGLRWKAPAVLLLSVLPWIATWQMRNWVETGYAGLSSVTDLNAYIFVAADVTAHVDHRTYNEVSDELGYQVGTTCSVRLYLCQQYLARHPEQVDWTQTQRLAFMHSEAVRVIRAHPGVYLRSAWLQLIVTAFDPGVGQFDRLLFPENAAQVRHIIAYSNPVRSEIALITAYPFVAAEKAAFVALLLGCYLLAAIGFISNWRLGARLWLLLGISLYFLAVSAASTAPAANPRYRLPIMPAVCVLAAAGIYRKKSAAQHSPE